MDATTGLPEYTLRVTPDEPGTVLIEALNANGSPEQEIWCTVEQARSLIPQLEELA